MDHSTHNAVYRFLLDEPGWVSSADIYAVLGVSPSTMRALCQEYPAVYVSSNQGYKLTRKATRGEVARCVQSLLGRAEKITTRAAALAGRLS